MHVHVQAPHDVIEEVPTDGSGPMEGVLTFVEEELAIKRSQKDAEIIPPPAKKLSRVGRLSKPSQWNVKQRHS